MKWLDVVIGEVQAKSDDQQARERRRHEVASATGACLEERVRPALQALEQRLRTAGFSVRVEEECTGQDAATDWLRLSSGDHGDASSDYAFLEFAAEPFHRIIVVWLRRGGEHRIHRFCVLRVDDVDDERIGQCVAAFEAGLAAAS